MEIRENVRALNNLFRSQVKLIAVSKTRSLEEMELAYLEGIRDFGENKVQELVDKHEKFHTDVRWHLIGHLQRNKVKYIVGKVYLIQSLDSLRLLDEIEKQYAKENKIANVLIQINIAKDPNKSGAFEEEIDEMISAIENCKYVKAKGLMAVIPKGDEVECRNYFGKMKGIFENLSSKKLKNVTMEYLSMGMTGDYMWAVKEGSNVVRIGEGIFGKRNYNNI
ncbi:YggS family pyridoxal phosphate-dependent enzyme [Clostridium sp. 19966]|uniref:YggS family pyridoxal phosphate-dependent enzyme n=1 Tax=Clostridium sp. 19966 TaxID=2768166 RepID=UPI0028DF5005|nr:YggS family pyridoxal phosphate-dependent enzyme [Clostridium sp. 19966]MDT8716615.1 YggS family pyridoxal phosphate-dependent enzyme [Clostridium sp. 19966]